jgi:putative lipoic acid-binding regulatory protein
VAFFRQAASTGDGGEEIKKEDDQSSSCDEASSPSEEGVDVAASATIRIDDGGSDLTDRFKYKVNALMGVFDPPADQDNERASGHILNAMLSFPTRYTFHVVGRGDTSAFSESVRSTVQSVTGDTQVVMQVTPRGTRFTKIMIEANVYNSNMITNVYEQLGALEQTVMRF